MNVLIVSQCSKNALKQSRRILDQFAERRGDRTWQTAITWQGLDTLRRLLKKSARKNTAVACHWIRGKDHSELLWIVGNASCFNSQGAVPTNTTEINVLRQADENDWHSAEDIRLLAALAALFHDMGKANRTFQKKLASEKPLADPLRHEWVSLRLFEAFVGKDNDRGWLERLAELSEKPDLRWLDNLLKDSSEFKAPSPFRSSPPLAQAIGWLIVGHHRLPTNRKAGKQPPNPKGLDRLPAGIYADWCGALINSEELGSDESAARERAIKGCWEFDNSLPLASSAWQERARRFARRILSRPRLFDSAWLDDPYVMHMARLILMLSDHHYSSLTESQHRVQGDPDYPLLANTRRDTGGPIPNQPLDEHLIGVEMNTGRIAHALPQLEGQLPRIARHKGFKQRCSDSRFRWQDKAYDLAGSFRTRSAEQGFFGINMASTGCGKTLANGRIMYALADPLRGARFTIALGLRTLTLQTGEVYRQRLGLGADDLAILVGGSAVRELYQHNQRLQAEQTEHSLDQRGCESNEELLPDNSYVHYEGSLEEGPLAAWLSQARGVAGLLNAPILTCTIDHLMPATESFRGGHQIAPMLRLMSSDLVLDEPDDFGLEDLPALARLVYWAGLLGSRVLLSSATLPPALVQGLFNAYREGRKIYQENRGIPGLPVNVCCAWFDEFGAQTREHATAETFIEEHRGWVAKRVKNLARNNEVRRRADIVPLPDSAGRSDEEIAQEVAAQLKPHIYELHGRHHSIDPHADKRVSFGLIRMANIDPLVEVTRALAAIETQPDCRLHLCCYHSQHPLLVRSHIERRLDNYLDRQKPDRIFEDPELRATLNSSEESDHLFIVLATAVAEVGRDHDFDWAIVEPSSMRSIIQLAGRVRRHRPGSCNSPNLYLLDTNLRHLKHGNGKPAFCKPGFEDEDFPLESHRLTDLLTTEQLATIDATPRIIERADPHPRKNLVDLEHDHLRAVMLSDSGATVRKLSAHHWWTTRAHLSGELQRAQPFRYDPQGRVLYAFLYDEESEAVTFTRIEHDGTHVPVGHLLADLSLECAPGVSFWAGADYVTQLEQLAEEINVELPECARRFGTLELPEHGVDFGWDYHPALGLRRHR